MASKPDDTLREYYILRLLQWREAVERLDAVTAGVIRKELNSLRGRLGADIADAAEALAGSGKFTRSAAEGIERWLDDTIGATSTAITQAIAEPTLAVASASTAFTLDMLSVGGRAKGFVPPQITDEMLREWLTQSPNIGQMPLNAWVEKTFSHGIKGRLFDALAQANVEGQGYGKMLKGLMQEALEAGVSITQREASVMARTYIQTANVGAMNAVYDANKELIPRLRWTTGGDNHVCFLCAPLDGHSYKNGEQHPPMPRHFGCRCVFVPQPKSFRDIGLDMDDIEAVRRFNIREEGNLATKHRRVLDTVAMKGNYADWWATLPPNLQAQSIGDVRAGLIREGKLSWKNLVDYKTGRYYSLEEVGFTQRGRPLWGEAESGKRHGGAYRDAMELPLAQVKKSVRSLDKQIQIHAEKISDPEKALGKAISDREAAIVTRKWEKDIERQRELKFIYQEAVNRRENK